MADKPEKKSMTDKLIDKAKAAVFSSIDKGTPSVMKGEVRRKAYDDYVDQAAKGRQSTDSNN